MARILLVDDDRDIRESLLIALVHQSYDVVTAANGEDGLKKFLENEFCCVVTDVNMPIMDGPKMVSEIRIRKPEQKVVIMTGDLYFKFGQHPEIPILYKPFRTKELLSLISPISSEKGKLSGGPNSLMDFELT